MIRLWVQRACRKLSSAIIFVAGFLEEVLSYPWAAFVVKVASRISIAALREHRHPGSNGRQHFSCGIQKNIMCKADKSSE